VVEMKTVMLRIRVEPDFKELLQKAVSEGISESMSELVRMSISKFLLTKEAT
jgi:hypothetical protein